MIDWLLIPIALIVIFAAGVSVAAAIFVLLSPFSRIPKQRPPVR